MSGYSSDERPSKRPKMAGFSRHGTPTMASRAGKNPTPGSGGGGVKSSFAAKMMSKMGWKEGEGLGSDGKGRLAPIETQLRPQGAGVGMVKEKSKQTKDEEKRAAALKGETFEDSSEEERRKKKERRAARKSQVGAAGGVSGTPGSAARRKIKYRTADEFQRDLEGLHIPLNVLEGALDLTGKGVGAEGFASPGAGNGFVQAREETAEAKAQNRMRMQLEACAQTRHGLNDRKAYLDDTSGHLVEEMDRAKDEILKLKDFANVVHELQALGGESLDAAQQWRLVRTKLAKLEMQFSDAELDKLGIQDVVIAAIHPLFKTAMLEWEPPEIQESLLDSLGGLQQYFGLDVQGKEDAVTHRGDHVPGVRRSKKSTTAYETMIYQHFLQPLRTYVGSAWNPSSDPDALPALIQRWRPLLPPFVFTSILEQLVIPKLTSALESWRPSSRRAVPSPDTWIFPWLPLLPAAHLDPSLPDGLLVTVKRRLRSILSAHSVSSGLPSFILPWKSLLQEAYQHILTTKLVPRVAAYLAQSFAVDPADQDVAPLQHVLDYATILTPSTMAQILKAEFMPKFASTLYEWLTDMPQYGEVVQWYAWWKEQIPASIREHKELWEDWAQIFQLMVQAADLGEQGKSRLSRPNLLEAQDRHRHRPADVGPGTPRTPAPGTPASAPPSRREPPPDSTFKDILEMWCEENDVLLVAMREAHEGTGAPLFRVTASADQKGGVVVFLRGDVLYARNKRDKALWEPMGVGDELMARASGR